jgi:quinol-cytochrome oxidoreductase complex cytochrome b subunit
VITFAEVITRLAMIPSAINALGIILLIELKGTLWQWFISLFAIGLIVLNHLLATQFVTTGNKPHYLPMVTVIGWVATAALIVGIVLSRTRSTPASLYFWSQVWSVLATLYCCFVLINWNNN